MSIIKSFFKDTFIYGLATVFPRLLSFLLVPLYTGVLIPESFSDNTLFYVYAAFFNVLLTYGMETAFFRFFSSNSDRDVVVSTAFIGLFSSTLLFAIFNFTFSHYLSNLFGLAPSFFKLLIGILVLDTLVVIPFAHLRARHRTVKFSIIKISNVGIATSLNLFFLWVMPKVGFTLPFMKGSDLVIYIFIANLFASFITFLWIFPEILILKWKFDMKLFKQMFSYAWPVMIAGLAFVLNESFDKWLLPRLMGKEVNGAYSACYKIAVVMTLFIQSFRMGAEPFFFNYAKETNAKQVYAKITTYFVIVGSFISVFIIAYLDIFKELIVRDKSYWFALDIVPIILYANLLFGIYFNLSVWYKLTEKTRYGMYFSLVGALITVVANLLFIPIYGYMASAWTTLAAYGVMIVFSYLYGQKHYRIPYPRLKVIGYFLFSISLSVFLLNVEKGYRVSTLTVLLFAIIICLGERKYLRELIRRWSDHRETAFS